MPKKKKNPSCNSLAKIKLESEGGNATRAQNTYETQDTEGLRDAGGARLSGGPVSSRQPRTARCRPAPAPHSPHRRRLAQPGTGAGSRGPAPRPSPGNPSCDGSPPPRCAALDPAEGRPAARPASPWSPAMAAREDTARAGLSLRLPVPKTGGTDLSRLRFRSARREEAGRGRPRSPRPAPSRVVSPGSRRSSAARRPAWKSAWFS